jgi:PAS domain S-box-containing protein
MKKNVTVKRSATKIKDALLFWRGWRRSRRKSARFEQIGGDPGWSEERFRSLIRNASDIVTLYEADGTIRYVSPAIERVLGYKPEERIGANSFELIHPDDVARAQEAFAKTLRNPGAPLAVELRLRHRDGSWRHIEATGTNLLDDPSVGAIVLNSRDITERRHAEERLQQSEERYWAVIEQTIEGIYLGAADTKRILESNAAFQKMLGYNAEELRGMHIHDLVAHDPKNIDSVFQSVLDKGHRFIGERRYRRKDGSTMDVETSATVVSYDGREVLCTVVRDITERKRAEDKLREVEERYRTLVEQIPAVTYIREANGSNAVTYVSPQMKDMLGYKPEEYTSDPEHWSKIVHPSDRKRVLAEDARTKETGEPFRMEYRQFAEDGRVVWIRDESALVRDEEGRPRYWIGVQIAVTERKRAEQALQESELRLRTVTTNVPVVLFALDRAGVFKLLEGKGLEVLGLEPGEAVGRSISEVYGDRPEILEDVDRALAGEEFSAVREMGPRIFETWYSPLRAITGEVSGVIGVAIDVTERERVEEALRESEERFRSLIQNASDIITLLEADGTIRYQSPSIERMLGYSIEELVGKNTFDYVHPEDLERVLSAFAEGLADPKLRPTAQYRFRHKDGSWRWLESVGSNLLGDPKVGEFVVNSRDITERKGAEQTRARLARQVELRANVSAALAEGGALESTLQRCAEAIVENLGAAFARVWTLNEEESVLHLRASAGMYTHTDGPHGRVPVGEFKIGLIARERRPHLTNDVANDPRIGDKEWAEREEIAAFAGYPLLVENRLVGVMALFAREPLAEDTTEALAPVADVIAQGIERKRAEEALQRSEKSLAEAQRTAHIGNWEYEVEEDRARWSDEMYRIFGFSPSEFVPTYKAYLSLLHPDDKEFMRRSVREALYRGGQRRDIEYRIVRPDGAVRSVYTEYEVLRDESGKPKRLVGTVHDVTERKRAEDEIKEANRRLEDLAVLKADFTAMVAHELDTPLAVIRGYADMLATGELEPIEQSGALAKIQAETDVLNALVADVRVAAAVEREDFAIEPRRVPVDTLLKDAAVFVETLPGNHPLVIENAADGQVWADSYRIGQVLRNLLSNAAKYSPDGAPIELRAKPGDAPGRVRIEVADQGVGIDPDDVVRVFEKFGRGRDRSGRKVAGVGLGLYLSRRILQAHGSDLTLNPRPAEGSVFGFELRAAR